MTATSTALAVHRGNQALTSELKADIWAQAGALIKARMFPKKFKTQEEAFMVALYGRGLGLDCQQAWKQIHLIKGQPALEVHLQVARVRQSIPGLIWKIIEHTAEKCVIQHGRNRDDLNVTEFTFEEAHTAGLDKTYDSGEKSNWDKYRKDMLYARAAGRSVRWFYPETQGGLLHNVEELTDALAEAPKATAADGVAEIQGDGRMPKRAPGKVVEAVVVEAEPLAAEGEESQDAPAPEPPELQVEQVNAAAVAELGAILAGVNDPKALDQAYAPWRTKYEKLPVTLIAGYEAKEDRLKALTA